MRRYFVVAAITVLSFVVAVPLMAANSAVPVPVPAPEPGNYVVAGDRVEVAKDVESDVYAVGRTVVVSGRVGGDVLALGGRVRITGPVTGNVRVLGGTVELASSVGHNVSVAGGSLVLAPGARVLGHVLAAVSTLTLQGTVEGTVKAAAQQATLAGTTQGAVELWLDRNGSLHVAKSARADGAVRYHAATSAEVEAGAQLAHAPEQVALPYRANESRSGWLLGKLAWLFGLAVLAMVLTYLMPKKVQEVAEEALAKPWPSLGWGALWAFAVPIVALLLIFTFIGLPFMLVLVSFYLMGLVVSQVAAGAAVGWYLRGRPSLKWLQAWKLLTVVFLGLLVFRLAAALPGVGPLVSFFGMLWGWGALLRVQRRTAASFR